MQTIAAEKRLHECPTEIKVTHMGLACWELQGIKILIPFYLVFLSVVSQHAPPRGMKAGNNSSSYFYCELFCLNPPLQDYLQIRSPKDQTSVTH